MTPETLFNQTNGFSGKDGLPNLSPAKGGKSHEQKLAMQRLTMYNYNSASGAHKNNLIQQAFQNSNTMGAS